MKRVTISHPLGEPLLHNSGLSMIICITFSDRCLLIFHREIIRQLVHLSLPSCSSLWMSRAERLIRVPFGNLFLY